MNCFRPVQHGATDQSVIVRIVDSTDGTPETGVVFNTTGIDFWYRRDGATKTSITEATLSALNDAHSDGGILHIDDGYYRFDLPDAAFASGVSGVMIGGGVDNMVVIGVYVPLVPFNPYSDVIGTPVDLGSGVATIAAMLQDLADNGTAAFDRSTDSLQAIRDRGDAAWITIAAASIRTAIGLASANLDTQIGDLPTNAELTTALAAADDAVLAVLGALNAAAATGDPNTTNTIVQMLKQIVNILAGSDGIATFPAAATPGNGVSLAEVVRSLSTRIPTALSAAGFMDSNVVEVNDNGGLTGDGDGTPIEKA